MFFFSLAMFALAYWQVSKFWRDRQYREIWVFLVIWLIGFIYSNLVIMDIPLLTPAFAITWVIKQIEQIFSAF